VPLLATNTGDATGAVKVDGISEMGMLCKAAMRPRARSLYTLVGCSSSDVVQKLSVDSRQVAALSMHGVESCLVTVMAAVNNDASLLHCALRSLINLAHQSVPSALLSVCLSLCLSVSDMFMITGTTTLYIG